MDERFAQWARETTIYIEFRPDRIDVARELAQHMEDKCAVLESCGYEHDLAAELRYPHGDNDWTLRVYLEGAGA